MKRYLLDTNIAGKLIEKQETVSARVREARRQGGRIGINVPVLAELYYGVEFSSSGKRIWTSSSDYCRDWPFGPLMKKPPLSLGAFERKCVAVVGPCKLSIL